MHRKQVAHVRNEKEVLQSVSHDGIVKLCVCFWSHLDCPFDEIRFGTTSDENHLYLFMEYVPGGELFGVIRSMGRLLPQVSRFYMGEVLLALDVRSIDRLSLS